MRFSERNRPFDCHVDIALARATNKTLTAVAKIGVARSRAVRRFGR